MKRWIVRLLLVAGGLGGHELLAFGAREIVWNNGVSFGIFVPMVMITLVGVVILMVGWKKRENMGYWLLVAGTLINLLDRWRWGAVRDYWNLGGLGLYNNLADWLIAIGIIWLILK